VVPIQIKAQTLRRLPLSEHASTSGPFALMPDEMDEPLAREGSNKSRWRQSDVKRAIAAAEQAGLQAYRIEIATDGTISIIVGAPDETGDPGPYKDLLHP
jgi:hypothetical protein